MQVRKERGREVVCEATGGVLTRVEGGCGCIERTGGLDGWAFLWAASYVCIPGRIEKEPQQ